MARETPSILPMSEALIPLPLSSLEIADIATGKLPARRDHDEVILYSVGGMPIEDVAWATDLYRTAEEKKIGTVLNLWDTPALA